MEAHTVGPASKDVPESTIAAQPPSQTPKNHWYVSELEAH